MNLLFIGGAGFIGSSIIKRYLRDHTLDVLVLEPETADVSKLEGLDVQIIRGNLYDIELIESIIHEYKISKIIHLVSTMVPGCGYEDYKQEFENVMFPTVRLMQVCSREHIQFVYFSSGGTVYGERKTLEPFEESDPKEPISYYGLSKQMIENSILFEHRVSDLQYLILRPSNPYGPGQNIHGKQGLIAVSLGKIIEGKPITVWGDGSSIRDYIYIDDLAEVVVQLLEKQIINQTINIGSGVGYSVLQVLDTIQSIVNEDVNVEYTESRKNDVSNMVLSTKLLKEYVDVHFVSMSDGISRFYNQLKSLNIHA